MRESVSFHASNINEADKAQHQSRLSELYSQESNGKKRWRELQSLPYPEAGARAGKGSKAPASRTFIVVGFFCFFFSFLS